MFEAKKSRIKNLLFVGIWKATVEKSRIQIHNPAYGSKGPNPSQNVTDLEHCYQPFSATYPYSKYSRSISDNPPTCSNQHLSQLFFYHSTKIPLPSSSSHPSDLIPFPSRPLLLTASKSRVRHLQAYFRPIS